MPKKSLQSNISETGRRSLQEEKTSIILDLLNDLEAPVTEEIVKEQAKSTPLIVSKTEAIEDLKKHLEDNFDNLSDDELANIQEALEKEAKEKAKKDFYVYVQIMAHHFIPDGYIDGKHIRIMAEELQACERAVSKNQKKRSQILLPPGSMKSIILNLFVSWVFGRHPTWRVIHLGHGTQFVEDNSGRPIKDLICSDEYQDIFPGTRIKHDAKAAGRWETTKKGKYLATGVGSAIAGRRAHISICDDVISEQTAWSTLERTKINKWYGSGLRTRLLPAAAEIIVNTRYHIEDISGYLLKADAKSSYPWTVIKFPALLSKEASRLLGYPEGTSFWPQFWSTEALVEKKNDETMPISRWNALYQQEPTQEEGNIVKVDDFKIWESPKPPKVDYVILSVDTAFSTKERADFSAFTVWGIFEDIDVDFKGRERKVKNLILIDAKKGRWEFPDLCKEIKQAYDHYKPDTLLIEKKASGQSLIQELRRQGIPLIEYLPDKDKESRLVACTPFFKSGRIWVPQVRKFSRDVIDEVISFPYAPHDDYVDTTTMPILYLRDITQLSNRSYKGDLLDETDVEEQVKKKTFSYWNKVISGGTT